MRTWILFEAAAKWVGESESEQEERDCGTENEKLALPIAFGEVAGAEKIVGHAAEEDEEAQEQALIEKDVAPQEIRNWKEDDDQSGPGGYDPLQRELEVEEGDDGGCAERGEQGSDREFSRASLICFAR